MAVKCESLMVQANGESWINITCIGYDNGLLVAMISGCQILSPEDEKHSFVRLADAIKMNRHDLESPDCSSEERAFREAQVEQWEHWALDVEKGAYSHSNSVKFILALERYWDSRKGHKNRSYMLKNIRANRPDLFEDLPF